MILIRKERPPFIILIMIRKTKTTYIYDQHPHQWSGYPQEVPHSRLSKKEDNLDINNQICENIILIYILDDIQVI